MGQIVPFLPRSSESAGWSREERTRLLELAERFAAGGVRAQVIYGTTDDGDPWCVVKDEFEEVLIHVARIGDTFVVHHTVDDALRQGADLRAVLKERLAWEERPNVVIPFARQAQGLLALLVATAFLYDSAPHEASGDHPPGGHDHPDEPSPHLAANSELHAVAIAEDHALAAARPPAAPPSTVPDAASMEWRSPDWRSFAAEDDDIGRADHGGAQLGHAPTAPAWVAAISTIDVASAGPALTARPEIAPLQSPLVVAARPPTAPGSEAGSVAPTLAVATNGPAGPQHPETQPPLTAAAHPVVLVATLTGVDRDGDGRPDLPIQNADDGKPEPKPEVVLSHVHAPDHAALIIAVGQAFHHTEIG